MKNFNLFSKEKKEKLKIAGSIVGGITVVALSSCSISDIKSNDSSIESTTISSISSTDIPTTSNETKIITTKTETTTKKLESTKNITTIETTITPTPITTNIPATEKPIESTTKTVTTKEPIKTTIVTTTEKVETTTTSTSKKIEEPIEYNTRTDEIKGYYNNTELNDTKVLTEKNINNYEDFLSVANNLYYDTSTEYKNSLCFYYYMVDYNLDNNSYESCKTDSYIEKIIFLTLLNENHIDDDTLKKILKPYTKEELIGIASYIWAIFCFDKFGERYYDYSKIVIDENLKNVLTDTQNAAKKGDYKTVEKLCNENFGKYNDMADILLICYEYPFAEIQKYPTDKHAYDLSLKIINKTGVYERAHQKTLVLQ